MGEFWHVGDEAGAGPVGEARAQKFLASPARAQRVLDGGQHVVVVVLMLLDNQIITPRDLHRAAAEGRSPARC